MSDPRSTSAFRSSLRARRPLAYGAALAVCAVLGAGACSEDDDGGSDLGGKVATPTGGTFIGMQNTGGSGATGATGAGATGQGAGSSRGGSTNQGPGCPGVPMDAPLAGSGGDSSVCQSISQEATALPVDLYLMMDRSISMNEPAGDTGLTRWEAIREAVEAFVTSPDAGDIGAGIGFFGKTQNGDDEIDCNPDNYADPEVEIGLLSEVGEDILQAIDDTIPGGVTPTLPALEGALIHAKDWARDNPDRASMVVLVTDGYPTQCEAGGIAEVADAARAAAEDDPSVRTYVIGLDGTQNLEGIARAGGSKSAFVVDSADIGEKFVDVLLNISSAQLACSFEVPDSPDPDLEIDPDRVQVVYTPESSGEPEEVPRVDSSPDCDIQPNGGWYFSALGLSTRINVCPCTCSRFGAGRVDVRLGCQPIIGRR